MVATDLSGATHLTGLKLFTAYWTFLSDRVEPVRCVAPDRFGPPKPPKPAKPPKPQSLNLRIKVSQLYLHPTIKMQISMDKPTNSNISSKESDQLEKLRCIVANAVSEERLIIDSLLHPPAEVMTSGQRISDKVARFGGSWVFIISFLVLLTAWIAFNALVPKGAQFDPYPFILMNLILSCIAALQAPVVMMSQNRQEEKDRQRAENDYLINMKAELELRSLHQKMDLLLEEQIRTLFETQQEQMELLEDMRKKLDELVHR